jgi:hypothetical protein
LEEVELLDQEAALDSCESDGDHLWNKYEDYAQEVEEEAPFHDHEDAIENYGIADDGDIYYCELNFVNEHQLEITDTDDYLYGDYDFDGL